MGKEGSVAPQERVNITYKPATGDAQEEVELPLKMLFVGDYTGRPDSRPLEERKPINVDKDNFEQVLGSQDLGLTMSVPDRLSGDEGASLSMNLKFKKLADFGPDAIVEQVPELKKLMDLRNALTALKGPLGNVPAFRKRIQGLLDDGESREKLLAELGLGGEEG
ncbi:MAG: type VI secretion system contractile sheath small subunit [Polyangiaceae bacterium]|nr:type VI secretion system contractile sheath small subunit [Polyangiaceae bacterium]MCW5789243.1 type VI secretion system contractile sheath small subunit [Polyangiaceae bacterium]